MTPSAILEQTTLLKGCHDKREEGMCAMELVAWLANEPHSDHPACACPVAGAFLRSWNDSADDEDRQLLKPYLPRVVGTNDGLSEQRAWCAVDWVIREFAPTWLELAKIDASELRQLAPVNDLASLELATPILERKRKEASAAWDAAGAAAWDAARDAALYGDRKSVV